MPLSDQGIDNHRYMLIPRTLVFLTFGERILLIKGNPEKRLWANRYNGIGGHVEPGENALQAAQRELLEETGIEAPLRIVGTVIIHTGSNPGIVLFVFTGESKKNPSITSAEGVAEWIRLDALDQIPLVEDLPVILPAVLSSSRNGQVFSALYLYDSQGKPQITFSPA